MKTDAEIETKLDAITTALEAGNYSTARLQATILTGWIVTTPNMDFSKSALEWDRESLLNWLNEVKNLDDRSTIGQEAIVQIPVRRAGSQCTTCCSSPCSCC